MSGGPIFVSKQQLKKLSRLRKDFVMTQNQFGLIGLAVMGQNLVLNAADHGFSVSVYNRTGSKTEAFMAGEAKEKKITATYSLEDFVASLERPRTIQIMVQAGGPVDAVIEQLTPLLDEGDIIIDGGNSFFPDTERLLASPELDALATDLNTRLPEHPLPWQPPEA